MRIFFNQQNLVVWAPAKINLFLDVLGKRPDGYHEIATLMVAIGLYDTLIFRRDKEISLACNRPNLSVGPDNLVLRAARLLRERTGTPQGCQIRLTKRIPLAAGLAGGSTDAAATLLGLNQLWQCQVPIETLAQWSGELGSDIPFFFQLPAAWCTGRGEIVKKVPIGTKLDLVLVFPDFGCSTPAVFRQVQVPEQPIPGDEILTALEKGAIEDLGKLLHNRLQSAAEKVAPDLTGHLNRLKKVGAAGSLMSGSGSTLFTLCRNSNEAKQIVQALRRDASPGTKVLWVQSAGS